MISLSYVSVQILQRVDISALLPDPKGQRIVMVVYNNIAHFSNVTFPNILTDMVFSVVIMIQPLIQLYKPLHVTVFTRSRNLVIGLPWRYNNHRYYCWAEKLMLHRNWALQAKPAVHYVAISYALVVMYVIVLVNIKQW